MEWPFFLCVSAKIAAEAVPESSSAMNRNNYQRRNAKIAATRFSRSNLGVELLSQAADKKVQEKCKLIAEALAEAAIKGNASATRLLIDLAEGADWVKNEEAVQRVLEVVEAWSKEAKYDKQPGEMPAGVIAPQGDIGSTHDGSRTGPYVN